MKITYEKVTITDFIQALAALIAIPAAIWGIATLFIKDEQKEIQIQNLIELAEQSKEQTNQLKLQVEEANRQTNELILQTKEMSKSNELFQSQMNLLFQQLFIAKQKSTRESIARKTDIMPRFGLLYEDGKNKIVNFGESAILRNIVLENCNYIKPAQIYYRISDDNILESFSCDSLRLRTLQIGKMINLDEELEFNLAPFENKKGGEFYLSGNIIIEFENLDGDLFFQNVLYRFASIEEENNWNRVSEYFTILNLPTKKTNN